METAIKSYKQLIVWQKSMELVTLIYQLTKKFPKSETFGLANQMQRAAVSIASNIAEGRSRGSRKEFKHFLSTSYSSGAELETQLQISKSLELLGSDETADAESLLDEIMRMLNVIIKKLKANS